MKLISLEQKEIFLKSIKLFNIPITDIQLNSLFLYVELLLKQNQFVNLISRADNHNILLNHLFMSLLFSIHISKKSNFSILDVGTGGGLPGIPLSILYPNYYFVLIDGIQKKIDSVGAFINTLNLKNVITLKERTETLKNNKMYINYFNVVVARAVTDLSTLIKQTLPFLKKNSNAQIVTLKGGNLKEEVVLAKKKFKNFKIEEKSIDLSLIPEIKNQDKKFIIVTLN
ncbi:MAG: 16S rRNA (guanine(527)-N(7))-methyltransferase RsmG [Bacteroidetes bacterium]|nr:16S rRNA (guanine(527)-N(7))-methyltransferase RsmG [Bacteroidota bacterium]